MSWEINWKKKIYKLKDKQECAYQQRSYIQTLKKFHNDIYKSRRPQNETLMMIKDINQGSEEILFMTIDEIRLANTETRYNRSPRAGEIIIEK